jgi:glutathione S-transferase
MNLPLSAAAPAAPSVPAAHAIPAAPAARSKPAMPALPAPPASLPAAPSADPRAAARADAVAALLPTPALPPLVLCDLGAPPESVGVESWSPFALKAHRALSLAGLPYTVRRGRMPSDFRRLNPARQVPVLLVGDEALPDSTRILARAVSLAARAGAGRELEPADPRLRAEAWLWEDFADRSLSAYVVWARWADDKNWPLVQDALFGGAPWLVRRFVVPLIRRRVLDALHARDVGRHGMAAVLHDFRRTLDALEARAPFEGFWLGERPGVADVALFAMLHSLRAGLTHGQAREIKLRPALTDWLDRVDAATRPAGLARAPGAGG